MQPAQGVSMRIVISAVGSRGDVQPYLALALGLKHAGHHPVLATHANFSSMVAAHGIEQVTIEGDVQAMLQSPAGVTWLESSKDPLKFARGGLKLIEPMVAQLFEDLGVASEGADLLVYHPTAASMHFSAVKLGIPSVMAAVQPWTATGEFPSVMFSLGGSWGPLGNHLSHLALEQMLWLPFRKVAQRWAERQLGTRIPRRGPFNHVRTTRQPVLYGFSEAVIPRPASWGGHIDITGYWFLPPNAAYAPPADLQAFLASGPKPIYVGFGSMTDRDPQATAQCVLNATRQLGVRCVMLKGWMGLRPTDVPDHVMLVDNVPHDWLFPRMAAVVHHGGAGTTAAALKAGVPAVVVPFFADQHFWASRVEHAGVSPRGVTKKSMTSDNLAAALHTALTDSALRQRAQALGQRISAEDGVGRAVENILRLARPDDTARRAA